MIKLSLLLRVLAYRLRFHMRICARTYHKVLAFFLHYSPPTGILGTLVVPIHLFILEIDSLVLDSPLLMPMILLYFHFKGFIVVNY
jgi:hypothetical protein